MYLNMQIKNLKSKPLILRIGLIESLKFMKISPRHLTKPLILKNNFIFTL